MKSQPLINMVKRVRAILEENVSSVPLEGVTDVGTISINTVIENVLENAVESVAKIAPMSLFTQPKTEVWGMLSAYTGDSDPAIVYVKGDGHDGKLYNVDGDKIGNITNISSTLSGTIDGGGTISGYVRTTEEDVPMYHIFASNDGGGYIYKPADYLRLLMVNSSRWMRPVTELTPLSAPYVGVAKDPINESTGVPQKPLAIDSFQESGATIELYPLKAGDSVFLVYVDTPKITTPTGEPSVINCDDGIYHASCYYAAYLVACIKGYGNAESYKAQAIASLGKVTLDMPNATSGGPVAK